MNELLPIFKTIVVKTNIMAEHRKESVSSYAFRRELELPLLPKYVEPFRKVAIAKRRGKKQSYYLRRKSALIRGKTVA